MISGVRKLAIASNSMLSAGKHPGRLLSDTRSMQGCRNHFRVFSKYPQDIISPVSFVSVYNCQESYWMGSRDRCMHMIQILMIDMIYDDSGEYFMDPCKRNCFAEIGVDNTLNLKIIHWDLRYNIYQHPCDLMVKPFEWQPKEQRKMQTAHWEKWMQITWRFHNFCSKESTICRQHIFLTISYF